MGSSYLLAGAILLIGIIILVVSIQRYKKANAVRKIPTSSVSETDLKFLAAMRTRMGQQQTQAGKERACYCHAHQKQVVIHKLPGDGKVTILACDHTFDGDVMARDFSCDTPCAYSTGAQMGVVGAINQGAKLPLNPDKTIPLKILVDNGFLDYTKG